MSNTTALARPSALAIPDLLVDPLNPPPGFPSITPLTGGGGWFSGLGKAAGGLFSVVKDVGGRLAGGAVSVACTAGKFVAAHPVGVGVVVAAAVLGGAAYYGHKYVSGLKAEIARQQEVIGEQATTIEGQIAAIAKRDKTIAAQGLEIKGLKTKLQNATAQIAQKAEEYSKLTDELGAAVGLKSDSTHRKLDLAGQGKAIRAEIEKLKTALVAAQSGAKTDQAKIAGLESKVRNLETRYANVSSQWQEANATKERALRDIASLKGQLKAKDEEITRIRTGCATQVQNLEQVCKTKVDTLTAQHAQATGEQKKACEQEIAKVKEECAAQIADLATQLQSVYAQRAQANAAADLMLANLQVAAQGLSKYTPSVAA